MSAAADLRTFFLMLERLRPVGLKNETVHNVARTLPMIWIFLQNAYFSFEAFAFPFHQCARERAAPLGGASELSGNALSSRFSTYAFFCLAHNVYDADTTRHRML